MTQYAPATPPIVSSPAGTRPAPDYGPFGTIPDSPGVVYFGEKWGSRKGPTIWITLGSIVTAVGLLVLIDRGGIFFAICTLVLGVTFVSMGFYNRKNKFTLNCYATRKE